MTAFEWYRTAIRYVPAAVALNPTVTDPSAPLANVGAFAFTQAALKTMLPLARVSFWVKLPDVIDWSISTVRGPAGTVTLTQ